MLSSDATVFFQAMLVGLSIAAPVGPIGLLTIQRTLQAGMASGLATGLGAACADAVYGAIGAFGVSGVVTLLTGARLPLALAGGAVLLWLAWQTWRAPVAQAAARLGGTGLWRHFAGTFALTLANPATILSFVAVFSALSASLVDSAPPAVMVTGVFLGSTLWWVALTASVVRARHRFSPVWRRRINQISALILAAFALWQWGISLWQMA